jgi:hypothetical protein
MMEATRTVLGSTPINTAFSGGGRSKRKGRKHRMSKGRTIRNKKGRQTGGSIIQEFWNATGLINDMASNAYAGYKGLDLRPSSSVYRDQFAKAV